MSPNNEPTTHRIAFIVCPYCGVIHDGAVNVEDQAAPTDGDYNVCGKCCRVTIYDSSVLNGLRLPTLDEQEEALANPDIKRAVSIARSVRHIVQRKRVRAN
jgi:hypothetical protein